MMNEVQKQFFRLFIMAHTIVVILSLSAGFAIGYAIGWLMEYGR